MAKMCVAVAVAVAFVVDDAVMEWKSQPSANV